ncbi:hypothetical protein DFH07DRAFT_948973 [Mycena maculata]|uniref:Uncharacterized protein n=1 Tax=Mycena maculata TaxID=230809 RepID=A0AAD7P1K2_9AGAR|nr:hypothetical protein DFH07DRAFT_948973 [Mycena maculata]
MAFSYVYISSPSIVKHCLPPLMPELRHLSILLRTGRKLFRYFMELIRQMPTILSNTECSFPRVPAVEIFTDDLVRKHFINVAGGFYLTDSLVTAAQYACYKDGQAPPHQPVDVLEFSWNGQGFGIYDFTSIENPIYEKFEEYNFAESDAAIVRSFQAQATHIYRNAMITAPMNSPDADMDLTDDFWQYAIVKQDAVTGPTAGLRYKTRYSVYCSKVPKGNGLTPAMYTAGQGGNPAFATLISELTTT